VNFHSVICFQPDRPWRTTLLVREAGFAIAIGSVVNEPSPREPALRKAFRPLITVRITGAPGSSTPTNAILQTREISTGNPHLNISDERRTIVFARARSRQRAQVRCTRKQWREI
jgi:hypothetical protein